MKYKFFNYTMTIEEFIRLNWDDLPEQMRQCVNNYDYIAAELECQIDNLRGHIDDLESENDDLLRDLLDTREKNITLERERNKFKDALDCIQVEIRRAFK